MQLRSGRVIGQTNPSSLTRALAVSGGSMLARYARNSVGPYLNSARRTAMSRLFRGGMRYRRVNQSRRNGTSGVGVTTQHDERRVYRKRRMPRRRRRRWRLFKNKVLAVSEKDLGSRTVVFNNQNGPGNVTPGNCVVWDTGLYGGAKWDTASGSTNNGNARYRDLSRISKLENTGDPTANAGSTIYDTTKFIFKSAVMDLTIRNASNTSQSGLNNSQLKMEVDIYEIMLKNKTSRFTGATTTSSPVTLLEMFASAVNWTPVIGGAGTNCAIARRGVTPFDLVAALSFYGMKILKKTKYMIPNGDTITYQIRDPRRHVFTQEKMESGNGSNVPGVTRYILINAQVVPGLPAASSLEEKLEIGHTRKYFYKIEGVNEDRDIYISETG